MKNTILFKEMDLIEIDNTPFALLWHVNIPEEKVDSNGFSDSGTSTGWQDSDREDQD
jgi:hypothetical protein